MSNLICGCGRRITLKNWKEKLQHIIVTFSLHTWLNRHIKFISDTDDICNNFDRLGYLITENGEDDDKICSNNPKHDGGYILSPTDYHFTQPKYEYRGDTYEDYGRDICGAVQKDRIYDEAIDMLDT